LRPSVWLVDFLEEMARDAAKPVWVFISSRLNGGITEWSEAGPGVAITATENRDDIAIFVQDEIARRPQWSRKLSAQLLAEIVRMLCGKSKGM
jgi:hypothetical protein